ncbi:MAG: hypothetical protein IIA72_17480 [Proteobacteria bacterium]|nr:hypothetical protein [Pseudomonadota bacterium]
MMQTTRTNGKPKPTSGSILTDTLRTFPIEALIEECARRGYKVEATDV